jgi:hypothetical protein
MKTRTWVWGALVWLAAVATLAAASEVKVTPLCADGHVFASFSAPAAFTADAREVVESGLPLTFTFTVELRRASPVWFDHTLSALTLAASVKYDNLTRVYQVSKLQEGRVTWSDHTDEEDKMRVWVTVFDGVSLDPTEALEPNADYYVRVRLRASPRRTFSFWPFVWPFGHDDGSGRADFTFLR